LYLRAAAAKRGHAAEVGLLPFNTLAQRLRQNPEPGAKSVLLLMPWDFVAEADWRSGIGAAGDGAALREAAETNAKLIARQRARLLYVAAPIPPILSDPAQNASLSAWLLSLATGIGANAVPAAAFSLAGYFSSGCPVGGNWIGRIAESAVDLVLGEPREVKKVLVTDLDNVLWSGGIAEDGIDGIAYESHGRGFPHFVYQSFLRRLRSEGTLLAAVSRNDAEIVAGPFRTNRMMVSESDFVAVIASYHAKSAQIGELAARLNLGLDSFVFVDDNPVEIEEVSRALPQVKCVPFPADAGQLVAFFEELSVLFGRQVVTHEDRERTDLYRRRLDGLAPSEAGGADITQFLRELTMSLTVHDRSRGDRTRAVQLINKTNQFNLNGRRVSEEEVAAALDAGGRLFTASLSDRTGSHGEIVSCLIAPDGVITSLVMSCRVFQRHVEFAFTAWLATHLGAPLAMEWVSTPRNEPFAQFLREVTGNGATATGRVALDAGAIRARFERDLELFTLTVDAAS
jgi:FkbH-like protein